MKEAQELLCSLARNAKARFLTNESFPAQVVEILGTRCKVDAHHGSWTQWQRYQNGTTPAVGIGYGRVDPRRGSRSDVVTGVP